MAEVIEASENELNLVELTTHYGLHSYAYEKSRFVSQFQQVGRLGKGDVLFDLGCGYGEAVCALASEFREARFYGIEIIDKRVEVARAYARHLALDNVQFMAADLLSVDFSAGNYFYVYSPVFSFQYSALLAKLQAVSQQKTIFIIAEAVACTYFDALTWLTPVYSFDVLPYGRAKLYRSCQPPDSGPAGSPA